MDESERDLLTIKRDGLLKKKRLFDAIEKLRQEAPKGKTYFQTSCNYLTDAIGIHYRIPFKTILDSIESEGAATFKIEEITSAALGWGYNTVEINITEKFDDVSKKIREEYHKLNKELGRDKEKEKASGKSNKGWIYYTNLIWLLWKFINFFRRHKFISSGIIITLGLLAIDYSLAWKNVLWLLNFINNLFN